MAVRDVNFWTEADQAECDVLIWELVTGIPEHRERCALCAAERTTGFPCPAVGAAIEAVLDWRRRRMLLSRAEYLRRLQDRVGDELVDGRAA